MLNPHTLANLNTLADPGRRADRTARRLIAQGVVKSRTVAAGQYSGVVSVPSRYGVTVDVPGVQFGVPVQVGDVVSLETVGGNSLAGIYGTPVRPKGPNVLAFQGPLTSGQWADDTTAPEEHNAVNERAAAYVYPVQGDLRYLLASDNRALFTLPLAFSLQYSRPVLALDFLYTPAGGLMVNGTTPHPLRNQAAVLELELYSSRGLEERLDIPRKYVNMGLSMDDPSLDIRHPIVHQGASYASYFQPLPSLGSGQRFAIAGDDLAEHVGEDLVVQVAVPDDARVRQLTANGFEWRDGDGVWRSLTDDGPKDDNDNALPYTYWMGFRTVELVLAELGTGSA